MARIHLILSNQMHFRAVAHQASPLPITSMLSMLKTVDVNKTVHDKRDAATSNATNIKRQIPFGTKYDVALKCMSRRKEMIKKARQMPSLQHVFQQNKGKFGFFPFLPFHLALKTYRQIRG